MIFPMRWLSLLLCLLFATAAQAENISPWVGTGHARARLIAPDAVAGEVPFFLGVEVESQSDWHYYWANPGDSGIPTEVKLVAPEGFVAGPLHFPVPERFETEGLYNYGYAGKATFLLPVTPPKSLAGSVPVTVKLAMLICHDICVPEKAEFALTLTKGQAAAAKSAMEAPNLAAAQARIPQIWPDKSAIFMTSPEAKEITFNTVAPTEEAVSEWDLLVLTPGVTAISKAEHSGTDGGDVALTLPKGAVAAEDSVQAVITAKTTDGIKAWQVTYHRHGVVNAAIVSQENAATPQPEISAPSAALPAALPTNTPAPLGFGLAILFALIGGLILNAMPCVFPVLSLKALAIARKADAAPRVVRLHGLAYTAGVLLCFAVLGGGLLLLKAGGQSLGWGFQLQQPGFVSALCCLFLLMGLNLAGLFEWPLLGANTHGPDAQHHPYGASFFGGLLAALVATPCTAPFMAGALGAALTLPPLAAMAIFLALGIGLALPFLLLSVFPHLVRRMPKPGVWMQRLKEILAFPMFAAALWLLWVVAQQLGALGLAWNLAALFWVGLAAWAWRFVQFRAGSYRLLFGAAVLLVLGALLYQGAQDRVSAPMSHAGSIAFSAAEIEKLRAAGTPVFVDATAAWCLTCKVNERSSLNDEAVKQAFAAKGVVSMVADWTRENPAITEFLADFGRNGVPLYVYYPPQGKPALILPQLLTPRIVLDALESGE